jgi:hypothetical protein
VPGIKDLTLRGMVAYAVRCAMRVRPLYVGEWAVEVDGQIREAADFCGGCYDGPVVGFRYANCAADAASSAADDALWADYAREYLARADFADIVKTDPLAGRHYANCAAGYTIRTVVAVAEAKAAAAKAAEEAGAANEAEAAARADLDVLVRLGHLNLGEFGALIDPADGGELGPLWREGEPNWNRTT